MRAKIFFIGVFHILVLTFCAHSQEQELLIVADFEYEGISEFDMHILVDLFSYTIFETGGFQVMNRYERNKLLRGFGYKQDRLTDQAAYVEAGELLQARKIVTGSCRRTGNYISLSLILWQAGLQSSSPSGSNTISRHYEHVFAGMDDLYENAREIISQLVAKKSAITGNISGISGLTASLYLTPIRERVLIVLPVGSADKDALDDATASARLLAAETVSRLLSSNRLSVTISSWTYDPAAPDYAGLHNLLSERDCHTLCIIEKRENRFVLCFYEALPEGEDSSQVKLAVPVSLAAGRTAEALRLAQTIEKELPLLSPGLLARELGREIRIKDKLDMLLFNERFLAKRFLINIHQSMIKPALVGKYHPMMNLLALEGDFIWYWDQLFGSGIGYSFSAGYPGTLDSKLSSHPIVGQHEFRIIPLSFRSAGNISVVVNLTASINLQNAFRIVYYEPIDKYEFKDETLLIMFKAGVNMGILINVDDFYTIYVDLVSLGYVVPFNIGTVTYDGTNISGGLGGVGLILRF
ncbi:MAG: hypothetical protein EHM28_09890 [Spirochaetaceae bacterium]|nr:MAG: hypothetical protein EHM28_09890 [Spirochaetaceae bacterium]